MVPYGISVLPFLIAAPALILILFAEALRVQFGALWQEEVHRRDRRDTAFGVLRRGAVPGAFEFVFGFDRRALAVEVARALEAAAAGLRNRDRLGRELADTDRDFFRRRHGRKAESE